MNRPFLTLALMATSATWTVWAGAQVLSHPPKSANRDPVEEKIRRPQSMGSPYVPPDSWIYPLFDRLMALGYVQSEATGIRPWTRLECARLLKEAVDLIESDDATLQVHAIYRELASEFTHETSLLEGAANREARLDSVYIRNSGISGTPLRDGFHFGRTLVNDFGRPFGAGLNVAGGVAAHAQAGPFIIYVRGEYQHAPMAPADPFAVRGATARADSIVRPDGLPVPVSPALASPEVNRFHCLDSYAGVAFAGWQVTVGKQSLWWGPSASGPMMFSDNAEPMPMVRLSRTTPMRMPQPFAFMGPVRSEIIFGRLGGHHFVNVEGQGVTGSWYRTLPRQPSMQAVKLSFKPTANLEFGFSRTVIFGGPGFPLNFGSISRALFSYGNTFGASDPGDRRAGFDFSYRVPGLRNWLTIYNDSLAEDQPSPIAYPVNSAMNPGLYLPQLPKLPKLDFRAEAAYTDLPGFKRVGFYYWNLRYVDGYTNQGNFLGNWVGREGRAVHLSSTYWFSPRNTLQVQYRGLTVNREFLQGGSQRDFTIRVNALLRRVVGLSAAMQYERWNFPLLATSSKSNLASTVELTFWPEGK